MSRPKLSICIPTRNRAPFLDRTIRFLVDEANFPFPVEICVSDNASEDATPEIVAGFIAKGYPVHYKRNNVGVNMWTNHANALRQGRGEYLFAMSDDDLLAVPQLVKVIEHLDTRPDIVAAFAPVEYYDEITGVGGKYSYNTSEMPETTVLSVNNALEAIDFFFFNVVPPELFIYRDRVVSSVFNNTVFFYSCYFDMCGLLLQGDVIFFKEPFYRWVTESTALTAEQRAHAGIRESQSGWDQWRGAMEEMVHTLMSRAGLELQDEGLPLVNGMLDAFEMRRMEVTLGAYLKRYDYMRSYEILVRLRTHAKLNKLDTSKLKAYNTALEVLPPLMPWAYLVYMLKMEQNCDRIYLVGTPSQENAVTLMRDQHIEVDIICLPSLDALDIESIRDPDRTRMIVVYTEAERAALLATVDYPAGQIIDMVTLAKRFWF